jgi:YVTN family beta-propeller protein
VPPTYAYLPQYSGNTINVVDLSDNSIISSPSLSIQQPEGIAVSSDNSRIYVGTADGVAVINGADRSLITTVVIPRGASYLCLTPDGSRLYVLSRITPNVYVIDTKTNTFIATVFTFGGSHSLSADPAGDWIYMQGTAAIFR